MGQNDRELPFEKTIGDAVRGLVRKRWSSNAAKMLERSWDLDPKTARNVVGQGNVSERTLTKAIRSEGWGFLLALGQELTGQTYDQYLEQRIEETRRVHDRIAAQRQRLRALEAARASQPDHLEHGAAD